MRGADIIRIKPRTVLTRQLAMHIHRYKIENSEAVASAVGRVASMLAGMYSVSEKTIRDVWIAQKWSKKTHSFGPTKRMQSANGYTSPPMSAATADATADAADETAT